MQARQGYHEIHLYSREVLDDHKCTAEPCLAKPGLNEVPQIAWSPDVNQPWSLHYGWFPTGCCLWLVRWHTPLQRPDVSSQANKSFFYFSAETEFVCVFCVRACVCACVRACVRVACADLFYNEWFLLLLLLLLLLFDIFCNVEWGAGRGAEVLSAGIHVWQYDELITLSVWDHSSSARDRGAYWRVCTQGIRTVWLEQQPM